ncbi:MAG: ABC transporter substrate-binding protein [Verrucomicrobia bacterium]|nr:ABC transporter substrate-binding protein [Verrucomicrobiota bacterium]
MKHLQLGILLALFFHSGLATKPASATTQDGSLQVIRIGHFPNVTHAQALIAHQLSRSGNGWFEERLAPDIRIEWFVYNAGPAAMEAIFAGSIDLTYVGPSPAINAYVRSSGNEIRVIAGAVAGGAALVVQSDGRIKSPADFRGKKIATPEFGNTQDIACRAWLGTQGFKITQLGGDVQIIPTANPDQITLFQQRLIDGAWTVEPWVSRLELEAKGTIYLEQTDPITTILVSSAGFLREHRALATALVRAHAELTDWINHHPGEAQALVRSELAAEMKHDFSLQVIQKSWPRLRFTTEISPVPFEAFLADAKKAGFLYKSVDLSRLVDTP